MKSNFLSKISALLLLVLFLNSFIYTFTHETKVFEKNELGEEENLHINKIKKNNKENKNPVPVKDFKKPSKRKCFHYKKESKKKYFTPFATRKTADNYYREIPFEPIRIHFDFSLTLPYEEKMLKELVIPPVKTFFENALSVRRVLGKLRVPRDMNFCQDIPIPKYLRTDGVNADLIILISTFKGINKYKYENNELNKNENEQKEKFNKNKNKNNKENKNFKLEAKNKANSNANANVLSHFLENFFKNKLNEGKEKEEKKNSDKDKEKDKDLNKTKNINEEKDKNKTKNIYEDLEKEKEKEKEKQKESILPWEVNDPPQDIVGWATNCIQDLYTLRPVVGVMQYVAEINPSQRAIEESIWTTLHEITHVLGMDYDLYGDFIDEKYNRKGYDNVIKIKTRLIGLDKILKERENLMDDFSAFINFGNDNIDNNNNNNNNLDPKNKNKNKNKDIENNKKTEENFIEKSIKKIKNLKHIKRIGNKMFQKNTEIEQLIKKIEGINFKELESNELKESKESKEKKLKNELINNSFIWDNTNFFTRVILEDEKLSLYNIKKNKENQIVKNKKGNQIVKNKRLKSLFSKSIHRISKNISEKDFINLNKTLNLTNSYSNLNKTHSQIQILNQIINLNNNTYNLKEKNNTLYNLNKTINNIEIKIPTKISEEDFAKIIQSQNQIKNQTEQIQNQLKNETNINSESNDLNLKDEFKSLIQALLNYFNNNSKKITLPVQDEYIEIPTPKNFNFSTLLNYIENFSENTKISIKTPKVIQAGKKHFQCDSLDGVELEHFGGPGSAYSHWSKRLLNTEFMIADSYGENYISNFTLSLLEDSGWYKIDYSKSEDIPWGKNQGCKFLSEKCIRKKYIENFEDSFLPLEDYNNNNNNNGNDNIYNNEDIKNKNYNITYNNNNTNNNTNNIINNNNIKFNTKKARNHIYEPTFSNEFCSSHNVEECSISHIFRAICGVEKNKIEVPKPFQYFDDPKISGSSDFGDYCPYPVEWYDDSNRQPIGSCRNGMQLRPELGEQICENCRCFISSLVNEDIYHKEIKSDNKTLFFSNLNNNRAACYEAKCKIENKKVKLIILIEDKVIKCPKNGGILTIEGYKGFIHCPKTESVCVGSLDPYLEISQTSAYNLFANLSQKLLNIIYDFLKTYFNR
jgi:hypothetical protein